MKTATLNLSREQIIKIFNGTQPLSGAASALLEIILDKALRQEYLKQLIKLVQEMLPVSGLIPTIKFARNFQTDKNEIDPAFKQELIEAGYWDQGYTSFSLQNAKRFVEDVQDGKLK